MSPSLSQPIPPETSLHYPRILCLHGGGSNDQIFHISCQVLEAQLADRARLVYVDAPFFAPPGPFITGAFTDWGPFQAWLPPALGIGLGKSHDVECINEDSVNAILIVKKIEKSLRMTMKENDQAESTVSWVNLLKFSQSDKIAVSLMLKQQHEHVKLFISLLIFCFCVLIAVLISLI